MSNQGSNFLSFLYRGAVIWLEPWRVSPNAFGNGDKDSLATRGKANEWLEPKTLSGAIRILMKLLNVNDKGVVWENEREGG